MAVLQARNNLLCPFVLLLMVLWAHGAPTPDKATQGNETVDGRFVLQLGRHFNNPLLRLIGQALLHNDLKVKENICKFHTCTEWGTWTECPVTLGFSMVTRSRACNKAAECSFADQANHVTTESRVCGNICHVLYNYTNGFCLKLFTEKLDHEAATQACVKDGGHLVRINSREKSDSVHALLTSHGTSEAIWTNGKRDTKGGPWTFTYGLSTTFDNWYKTEPSNGATELCRVEDDSPRKWFDRDCSSAYAFVCET